VLICSAATDTRLQALGIVRKLGVTADGVASAAQALAALKDREVHLLVLDDVHPPVDVASLQYDLATLHPDLCLVKLVADASGTPDQPARKQVPIEQMDAALGSTVMFALSNVL